MPILIQVDWKQRLLGRVDPLMNLVIRPARPTTWPPPKRILFLNIWAVGDVVLATPAIHALRHTFPNAEITMLGQPHARELLAASPDIDHIVTGAIPWVRKSGKYHPKNYLASDFRETISTLRSKRFDLALDGQMDPRGNLLLALSGAKRRVGFGGHGGRAFLTDDVPLDLTRQHSSQVLHQLVEYVAGPQPETAPTVPVDPARREEMRQRLTTLDLAPGDRLVAVHPGAGNPVRRWGLDRFAEVIRAIQAEPGVRALVFAEPGGYGEDLASVAPVWKTSLADLVATLSWCDLFVGADNGPMHIAAAVGTRVVGLYGPTEMRWYGPVGERHEVVAVEPMPCRPCGDRCHFAEPYCMTRMTTEMVLRQVRRALQDLPEPRFSVVR